MTKFIENSQLEVIRSEAKAYLKADTARENALAKATVAFADYANNSTAVHKSLQAWADGKFPMADSEFFQGAVKAFFPDEVARLEKFPLPGDASEEAKKQRRNEVNRINIFVSRVMQAASALVLLAVVDTNRKTAAMYEKPQIDKSGRIVARKVMQVDDEVPSVEDRVIANPTVSSLIGLAVAAYKPKTAKAGSGKSDDVPSLAKALEVVQSAIAHANGSIDGISKEHRNAVMALFSSLSAMFRDGKATAAADKPKTKAA